MSPAQWKNGTRLAAYSNKLFLREGLAELMFDNNAKVVVEGPAEFELLAEDQINLRYGRIYATIPHEAIGFTVSTPTSRIIDLGTEFGIQADGSGDVAVTCNQGKNNTNRRWQVKPGESGGDGGTGEAGVRYDTECFGYSLSKRVFSFAVLIRKRNLFGKGRIKSAWLIS